jgi:septum formation protein
VTSLCLASASPRRSQLLTQIGVSHVVLATDTDEARVAGESPTAYVRRLAADKARAARARGARGARAVLAADTAVVLGGEIFGKPADAEECVAMLGSLGGRTHEVLTAVALAWDGELHDELSVSRVTLRALGERECRDYWASGEPRDKAGGYAVQGLAAVFVERIEGSYSGVMGLPLFETARLLARAGVPHWSAAGTGR